MKRKVLGIDIGTTTIKVIEVLEGNRTRQVLNKMIIETPKGSIEDGVVINESALYQTIRSALQKKGIKTKKVYLMVGGSKSILREEDIACESERHLKEIIKYKIEDYLPIKGDEWQVDYQVLEKRQIEGENYLRTLLIALPKETVSTYVRLMERLRFSIIKISVPSDVVGALVDVDDALVVDIGGSVTTFTIVKEGKGIWSKSIAFGGRSFNQLIGEEFKEADEVEVERFKKEHMAVYENEQVDTGDFYGNYVSALIKQQVEINIIDELENLIEMYNIKYYPRKIQRIYVVGGSAGISSLGEYITKKTGITGMCLKLNHSPFPNYDENFQVDERYFINLIGLLCS